MKSPNFNKLYQSVLARALAENFPGGRGAGNGKKYQKLAKNTEK